MSQILSDIGYAARALRGKPGSTLAAVTALALGIGGCTALFSVVNAVLLRPLPYRNAESILQVWGAAPERGIDLTGISYQRFRNLQEHNRVFAGIGAYTLDSSNLTGVDEPEQLKVGRISRGVLEVLGLTPAAGRNFLPEEDQPDGAPVVILSDALWRGRFASDPHMVGKGIQLEGVSYTVIGIMAQGFAYPSADVDLWLPRVMEPNHLSRGAVERGSGYLEAIARLRAGVTRDQAQAEIDRLAANDKRAQFLDANLQYRLVPLAEQMTQNIRPSLLILAGAVGFVPDCPAGGMRGVRELRWS